MVYWIRNSSIAQQQLRTRCLTKLANIMPIFGQRTEKTYPSIPRLDWFPFVKFYYSFPFSPQQIKVRHLVVTLGKNSVTFIKGKYSKVTES